MEIGQSMHGAFACMCVRERSKQREKGSYMKRMTEKKYEREGEEWGGDDLWR